jgi:hypothetical protein
MPAMTRELARDLQYAARTLRASPAFTIAAALTLAIGIGANTAIFSAVDGVLLKPLPFANPDRIVTLWQTDPANGITRGAVAPANFLDWRERSHAFDAMASARTTSRYSAHRRSLAARSNTPTTTRVPRASSSYRSGRGNAGSAPTRP